MSVVNINNLKFGSYEKDLPNNEKALLKEIEEIKQKTSEIMKKIDEQNKKIERLNKKTEQISEEKESNYVKIQKTIESPGNLFYQFDLKALKRSLCLEDIRSEIKCEKDIIKNIRENFQKVGIDDEIKKIYQNICHYSNLILEFLKKEPRNCKREQTYQFENLRLEIAINERKKIDVFFYNIEKYLKDKKGISKKELDFTYYKYYSDAIICLNLYQEEYLKYLGKNIPNKKKYSISKSNNINIIKKNIEVVTNIIEKKFNNRKSNVKFDSTFLTIYYFIERYFNSLLRFFEVVENFELVKEEVEKGYGNVDVICKDFIKLINLEEKNELKETYLYNKKQELKLKFIALIEKIYSVNKKQIEYLEKLNQNYFLKDCDVSKKNSKCCIATSVGRRAILTGVMMLIVMVLARRTKLFMKS